MARRSSSRGTLPQRYSRPIPRRIVEEQGAPRELFGYEKRAITRFMTPWSILAPEHRTEYLDWLVSQGCGSVGQGPPPADEDVRRYIVHWAIERVKERYLEALGPAQPRTSE